MSHFLRFPQKNSLKNGKRLNILIILLPILYFSKTKCNTFVAGSQQDFSATSVQNCLLKKAAV
jgi:hypothetical protein